MTTTAEKSTEATAPAVCVHLLGFEGLLLEQQAYEEGQIAAMEARCGDDLLNLENDRTERLLREIGVCEF